ncbi:hypothetical protein FRC08_010141 [Ceratobasidium sp. 394]|nr:hypothetical protein FRC08_010141 [Ceratobasidium sp. 394]
MAALISPLVPPVPALVPRVLCPRTGRTPAGGAKAIGYRAKSCMGWIIFGITSGILMPVVPRLNLTWCLENFISGHVATPPSLDDLGEALAKGLEANASQPEVTPSDVTYDIILAGDNIVNQCIAVKILEKFGHTPRLPGMASLRSMLSRLDMQSAGCLTRSW